MQMLTALCSTVSTSPRYAPNAILSPARSRSANCANRFLTTEVRLHCRLVRLYLRAYDIIAHDIALLVH